MWSSAANEGEEGLVCRIWYLRSSGEAPIAPEASSKALKSANISTGPATTTRQARGGEMRIVPTPTLIDKRQHLDFCTARIVDVPRLSRTIVGPGAGGAIAYKAYLKPWLKQR